MSAEAEGAADRAASSPLGASLSEVELSAVVLHLPHAEADATDTTDEAHSVILHATPSNAPPAAPSPSWPSVSSSGTAADWQSELRAQWDTQAANHAARQAALRRQQYWRRRLPALTDFEREHPPLGGDVEWKTKNECIHHSGSTGSNDSSNRHGTNESAPHRHRRITVGERALFLCHSKIASRRFYRLTRQIISMLQALLVLATAILAYSLAAVQHPSNTAWARHNMLVYVEEDSDSAARQFAGGLLNGLTVLAAIVGLTAVFLVLYALRWQHTLRAFLTTVLGGLLLPWGYFAVQVISYHSFPVDVLSFAFLLFNAFVTLMVGLLCRRGAGTDVDDSDLNRAAMIAVGVSVSWPFMEFSEWTTWTTLVLLTLYDLVAVLAPCGPLKWIMEEEERKKNAQRERTRQQNHRQQRADTSAVAAVHSSFAASAVHAHAPVSAAAARRASLTAAAASVRAAISSVVVADSASTDSFARIAVVDASAAAATAAPKQGQTEKDVSLPGLMYRGEFFSLGLGDLVFYGALLGRAAQAQGGGVEGAVVFGITGLGVAMGMVGTILWSNHSRSAAIPALPLSVVLGLCCYAAATLAVVPCASHVLLSRRTVFPVMSDSCSFSSSSSSASAPAAAGGVGWWQTGASVSNFVVQHSKGAAMAVGAVLAPSILVAGVQAVGFAKSGIVTGTVAAKLMASGMVPATVGVLQSVGATAMLSPPGIVLAAATGAVVVAATTEVGQRAMKHVGASVKAANERVRAKF